jgi:SAM-dependent methyltransferase
VGESRAMYIDPSRTWTHAMQNYERELTALVAQYPAAKILELGGGRWPSFRMDQMPANIHSYTVNDVDPEELRLAGPEYEKACFDVSGDASEFADRYDVVFSRFLAEHVRDGKAMHRNVFQVLKPGGVAFHLVPTLYSTPFLLNRILPEWLGALALKLFRPGREISPKFKAYYSACYGNIPKMRKMLRDIGYTRVEIRDFYGHFYYEKIPGIAQLERRLSALAARKGWSWYSSYAYIIAYK